MLSLRFTSAGEEDKDKKKDPQDTLEQNIIHLPLWELEQATLDLIGKHLYHSVPRQLVSEPRKIAVS